MQVKRKNFIQLISEDSIKEKVNQIANEISDLYDNQVPILIGILMEVLYLYRILHVLLV